MTLFLNPEELFDLTGYRLSGKQAEWLRREGFRFKRAADGTVRLDREHYRLVMGGEKSKNARREPNFNALKPAA